MTRSNDEIVWAWNTTDLSASEIGREFGLTRSAVLGIVHRDPRSNPRRQKTPLQQAQRHIKALEAEVKRLQALEIDRAHKNDGRKRPANDRTRLLQKAL